MARVTLGRALRRRGRAAGACALTVVAATGLLGAGCEGPRSERSPEALPQVELPYERAVEKALDEVDRSHLLSVGLGRLSSPEPVWRTQVATDDGTVRLVQVGAIDGELVGVSPPAGQTPQRKRQVAALVSAAKVLPEEAVDRVKKPDFGKVTDVHLGKDRAGRTVWSVTVATVQRGLTHVYQVDARTAEVLDSRTLGSVAPDSPDVVIPPTRGTTVPPKPDTTGPTPPGPTASPSSPGSPT